MLHLHYLHHTLKRQLSELYVSTVMRSFSAGMMGIFAPLYLYHLNYSLTQILLFMALEYAVFAVASVTLGAHGVVHFGHERSIALSTPILLAYFALLYLLPGNPEYFYLIPVALGVHNGLYWVAYHSEFAHAGNPHELGSEIGLLKVFIGLIGVVAPAIGGFFVQNFGFQLMLLVAAATSALSLIPILRTPEPWKPGNISTTNIVRMFWNKRYQSDLIANLGTGEDVIAFTVWPVFLFFIIPSYQDIGMISTIAAFITFILFLWIGRLSNSNHRTPLIKRVSSLITISWLARLFAVTPFSVLISDTLYKISSHTLSIPLTALLYSRTKSKEIIEYTSFWMAALSLGKMTAALLAALIVYYTNNLIYTFLLAAGLSLLYFVWRDALNRTVTSK